MKKLKSAAALWIAVMLCMVMSLTAFAEVSPANDRNTETDGSITVNSPAPGQTYTLYRIFKADMGQNNAITYNNGGLPLADNAYFELNASGFVVAKAGVTEDFAKDAAAREWAESVGTPVGTAITANSGTEVKWSGLEYGYYYVKSTLGAFIGIDSANKEGTINEKNAMPSIDKEITGVKDVGNAASGCVFDATDAAETTDPGRGKNEQAIAQAGDTVSYKLTIAVKPGASNYVISDTLTNLKIVASSFMVDGAAVDGNAKIDGSGTAITDQAGAFTIMLSQSYLNSITAETELVVTYDAVLSTSAAAASGTNVNRAVLTWGDNPTANHSEDSAKVWTAEVDVMKTTDAGSPLSGAGFKLKKGSLYYKKTAAGITWVAEDEADEFTTGDDGGLSEKFTGLANGDYTLVESTVPDGYNKLGDTPVTILDENTEAENLSQVISVVNNAGTVLPSTGGIGTTVFYIVGAALIIGAAFMMLIGRRTEEE